MKKPTIRRRSTVPFEQSDSDTKQPGFFNGRFLNEDDLSAEQKPPRPRGRLLEIITRLRKGNLRGSILFIEARKNAALSAARTLAQEVQLPLYVVNLSQVRSEYIGEAEKNLRCVFAAAGASGAILLFDEADALFGKRGEVKESDDRYANTEAAYLLQQIEEYRGLVIVSSNRKKNIDAAFLRRFRFVVSLKAHRISQRRKPGGEQSPRRSSRRQAKRKVGGERGIRTLGSV